MVDVIYDPAMTSRRRRIEWPTMNEELLAVMKEHMGLRPNPTASALADAKVLLGEEGLKCLMGFPGDEGIWFNYNIRFPHSDTTRIGKALTGLYWRGRVQATILDTFEMLRSQGFMSLNSLRKHINYDNPSKKDFHTVSALLRTFEGIAEELREDFPSNPCHDNYSANHAVDWLAVMILRECADIPKLIATILESRYLGGLGHREMTSFKKRHESPVVTCDGDTMAGPKPNHNLSFGFWLPHGVDGSQFQGEVLEAIADAYHHFDRIERVYKAYFNITDDKLVTEEKQ